MSAISLDAQGRVRSVDIPTDTVLPAEKTSYDSNEHPNLEDIVDVSEPIKSTLAFSTQTGEKDVVMHRHGGSSVHRFLYTVPHLFTLTEEQITNLNVMVREYSELDIIAQEGTMLSHVFVLASGGVEVINTRVGRTSILGHRRVGSITAPNIFGMDEVILDKPTDFSYHASSFATLLLIPKEQFHALFRSSAVFASSVSGQIVRTLSAFSVFGDFCRSLFGLSSASVNGRRNFGEAGYKLPMSTVVNIYESSGTVFHKLMRSPTIDTDALQYCVMRLPENITETFVLILSRAVPTFFAGGPAPQSLTSNESVRRIWTTWRIGERGKTVVIARDGFTDVIDFVTNLCMLMVESKKIRLRLQGLASTSAMDFLRNSLTIGNDASDAAVKSVLSQLPFSEREVEGLLQVWEGPHVIKMLYNILLQHEEFVVYIDVNMSKKFTQDPYVNCCLSISRHIKAELGLSEEESLPDDLIIDIIFSPNTTIKNLLCSASDDFRQMLEMCDEWRTVSSTLTNPDDCYLYVLSQVLEQGETVRELYRQRLEASGFIMMEDTAGSALAVDLINVSKLCVSDMDASLRAAVPIKEEARGRSFIINVDGTFGAQIEAILRNLNLTFGKYIRSVNVSGSVAGLVGKRGDVVLPTKLLFSKQTFGEDSTDETRLCNEGSITEEDVLPFLGKDTVALHRGGCVTIPGIILYSDSVLRFYKVVHCCTAVDMRSSYVARQMEESRRTEILKKGLIKRFLFYMDSVPLSEEDDTGSSSQVTEILFSVYATTRSLLNLILSS